MPRLTETMPRSLILRSDVEPNIDRGVDDLESDILGAEELKPGVGTGGALSERAITDCPTTRPLRRRTSEGALQSTKMSNRRSDSRRNRV